MGTGRHGSFGHTIGAQPSKVFTRVQFTGSVKVAGEVRDVSRRIYQRGDIDFERYDSENDETNLEKMLDGRAPIGSDGHPIQLHHVIQKESGPVAEVREMTHQEYYRTLHGLGGTGLSFRNDPMLKKQYNNFRAAYWKWRAQQYLAAKEAR